MSGRVRRSGGRTTAADLDLLEQVASDNVTWKRPMVGSASYRLWSSETESVIVTPRARRLADRGLIGCWTGIGTYELSGGVELTAAGRDLLQRSGRAAGGAPEART